MLAGVGTASHQAEGNPILSPEPPQPANNKGQGVGGRNIGVLFAK